MEIELQKVSHYFPDGCGGKVMPLQEVDLKLKGGGSYALLGPSGSGKSTLLFIAGGLLRPAEGEVRVDGRSLASLSEAELGAFRGKKIGFIFQRCHLVPTLTVWENLALPAWVLGKNGKPGQNLHRAIMQILEQLGLSERAHFLPHQLSGGQRRRAALARALINNPEAILADEPTAEMDEGQRRVVGKWLLALREQGTTVMVATHDPWLAAQAQHVFTLQNGKLYRQNPLGKQSEELKGATLAG